MEDLTDPRHFEKIDMSPEITIFNPIFCQYRFENSICLDFEDYLSVITSNSYKNAKEKYSEILTKTNFLSQDDGFFGTEVKFFKPQKLIVPQPPIKKTKKKELSLTPFQKLILNQQNLEREVQYRIQQNNTKDYSSLFLSSFSINKKSKSKYSPKRIKKIKMKNIGKYTSFCNVQRELEKVAFIFNKNKKENQIFSHGIFFSGITNSKLKNHSNLITRVKIRKSSKKILNVTQSSNFSNTLSVKNNHSVADKTAQTTNVNNISHISFPKISSKHIF